MSEGTKIEWCDDTFNFWRGCTKVSPGCANCYAEVNIGVKMHGVKWGKGHPRVRAVSFDAPLKWNRMPIICDHCGTPWPAEPFACCGTAEFHRRRVFSLSLGDWLDDEVPVEWLAEMLRTIRLTPNLRWLLLTKRPENWARRLHDVMKVIHDDTDAWISSWLDGDEVPLNVWFGFSAENQEQLLKRYKAAGDVPSIKTWCSAEPLLGELDLLQLLADEEISRSHCLDWIVFGGESGRSDRIRECNLYWIQRGIKQARAMGITPFVKQLGGLSICDNANMFDFPDNEMLAGYGEGFAACRLMTRNPKGGDLAEWPEELRVREFPV